MDQRLVDMRTRTKRMLNKVDIYRESLMDILNIIDQFEADKIPLDKALDQIEDKMDLLDDPIGIKLN